MPENGTQTRPAGSPRDGNGAHEPLRELQAQPLDAYLDDQQQFADGMPDDTVSESSVSSVSTWTDFTHRYSWNWEPDCCLKIRKRVSSLTIGTDLLIPYGNTLCDRPEVSLIVKPHGDGKYAWVSKVVKKLTLTTEEGELLVETPKVHWKFLRLQAVVQHSRKDGFVFNYRATTNLGGSIKRHVYKKQWQLANDVHGVSFGVRPHVRLDMHLPEVTGSIGSGGGGQDVEKGYCHIYMPRLHFRLDLDAQTRPPERLLFRRQRKTLLDYAEPAVSSEDEATADFGEKAGVDTVALQVSSMVP